ncbi:MAG TPA: restriction endonuclease subunit S, partial [Chthonomonadaceae bacterium]|nr:restriction endonuclease subunit S [Chthonomonadaceae bacterium]
VAQVSSGGTPDRKNSAYWNGEIPWVKTGEINYNIIHDTDEKITEEGLRNSSTRIIPAGTLLLAMYGQGVTRGRVAILGIDASINQACAALCFNSQKVETRFIFYYLSKAYDAIRNLGHGANQTNLNATHIKSIPLPLPSLDEQHAVADALTACDQKIAALEAEAALHDELFRALLEELMTGRISTLPLVAAME